MLVCKAVEFKSSMEPNNIREFYIGLRGLMQNSTYLQNVFIP